MRVFISAGEASGDAYGAALKLEMDRLGFRASYQGMGSSRMRSVGIELVADSSHWGAVSILQSLKVAPKALAGCYRSRNALVSREAGLFVAIDFGFANIRQARFAKRHGWKVLYFVPPGSWRRDRQGGDLPKITDAISTPFSWSAEILNRMGANAHWFGHPIKQLLNRQSPDGAVRNGLAVLPGSRGHEISLNLPILAHALDLPAEFALAPSIDVEPFRANWERISGRTGDRFTKGDVGGVLQRARAAVVCSGTATLEAALCGTPMCVIYRFNRAGEIEAKLVGMKRPKFIALPNIILDRQVVPELVQQEVTAERIRAEVAPLLRDGAERERQIDAFKELDLALGPADAITRTAELAIGLTE